MRQTTCVVLVVGVLLLGGVSAALVQSPEGLMTALGVQVPEKPTTVPEFTVSDLHGQAVRLTDFRGKVILLNFWATWCGPCQWEMPEMDTLYQTFKDQGFVILAVALGEGAHTVAPFVTGQKLTYPVLLDIDLKAAHQYGITGPPTTFLIGRTGELLGTVFGPREWGGEQAKALVRHLLASSKRSKG